MTLVTGPRIDEDCVVSTYSTSQSTSILGAYDSTAVGTAVGRYRHSSKLPSFARCYACMAHVRVVCPHGLYDEPLVISVGVVVVEYGKWHVFGIPNF